MIGLIKALLIEDSPSDTRLFYEMAQDTQTSAIELTNTQTLADSISLLETRIFDVVLLDLGLPDSVGLETLTKLLPHANGAAIIILTGSDDLELGVKAIQAGAQDYLVKGDTTSTVLFRSLRYALQRKSNMDELAKAKAEIEKFASAMKELNADKDKFFAIVAHDLRSPFYSLLSISEFLTKDIDILSTDEIKSFASNIYHSLKLILGLLENLLEWSNLQSGRLEYSPSRFDISALAAEVCAIYQINAQTRRIRLINNMPPGIIVSADKNMIKTVLRNLLSNAIKFSDENGSVTVTGSTTDQMAEISVIDSGIGICSEDLKKLFKITENLKTSDRSRESGSGLGLILCKEFVNKNGGTISASSKPGEGSKFSFTVPLQSNQ